jgi:YesN/AraC family two-component response regulator
MQDDEPQNRCLRILLIDDEVLVRSGTAMMLDELGHIVIEASSGKDGLVALADDPQIQVLMTDYNMPDMNGIEVISQAMQVQPNLKTILMTGFSSEDHRFADSDIPRLEKPFGLDGLESALGKLAA